MQRTDGGPQPVTLGGFSNNLDTTVFDGLLSLGSHACGTNRRNNGTGGCVGPDTAGFVVARSARTVTACLCDVERVAVDELLCSDARGLGRQSRDNVETLGVNVAVLWVVGRPVELAVSETTSLKVGG